MKTIKLSTRIPADYQGERLDKALSALLPDYSRSQLKIWIDEQKITVNGQNKRPRDRVCADDIIHLDATLTEQAQWSGENIPLDIIYEDHDLLIINKPAGLVVHPAVGNLASTLVNALLFHYPSLALLPRAGLIHRLDKETSGLLMIAKTLPTYTSLTTQLQERTIERYYIALVHGTLTGGGTINQPIGRHPRERTKMAIVHSGKTAMTHYRIKERFAQYTLLNIKLETGRTHQIRVHLASIHHAVIGDKTYGKVIIPQGASEKLIDAIKMLSRQMLHAERLSLIHPVHGERLTFNAPLPADMVQIISLIQQNNIESQTR